MADIHKLIFHVSDALSKRQEPPEEAELRKLAEAHAGVLALTEGPYTRDQIDEAIRKIQINFDTRMGLGALFEGENYRPWLNVRRGSIEPYYWRRYDSLLRAKLFPPLVVGCLDQVSSAHKTGKRERTRSPAWE